MTIVREWLPWDRPCLPQAAAWLVDRVARAEPDVCDLREVLCVLPGRRAARLLLAELLRVCRVGGAALLPPQTVTPGAMVDAALAVEGPVASEIESQLAWIAALRALSPDDLKPLLPIPPAADDLAAWSDLAATLGRLHGLLAGDLRSFIEVAETVERMQRITEGERWRAIEAVHRRQRETLHATGLVDAHEAREAGLQAAIRAAAAESLAGRRIVLIGVTDLNRLQRACISLNPHQVTALVHAPRDMADGFDAIGAPREEAWRESRLDVPDASIIVAERPADMAQYALRAIASFDGRFAGREVTVGLGDASLLGEVTTAARWAGLSVHAAAGEPLSRSAPWRLLEAAADWIDEQRFEPFAALLRHPDAERFVRRSVKNAELSREEWLTLLDDYFAEHLQSRFTGNWMGSPERQARLKAVHEAVQTMLHPFLAPARNSQTLGSWCQAVLAVLANVYAIHAPAESNARAAASLPSIDACLEMRDAIASIPSAPASLQPVAGAAAALRLLLAHAGAIEVAAPAEPDALEAMGWLELHLDSTPALIIVGMNDGWIPEAVTSDAFLPDGLRTALGMMNNDRRYARDAYLLQAMQHSRAEMRLIVGRRNAQAEPLTPSRLLLACDDATLVRRVHEFTRSRGEEAAPHPVGLPAPAAAARSAFTVPQLPGALTLPDYMSVTAFKMFLTCPFRFALERLLRLEARDDSAVELDPLAFGDLAHRVLCTLADPALVECDERQRIYQHLQQELARIVRAEFGESPLTALRVQIARLEQRLRSFAGFQAKAVRDGWRIRHCEFEVNRTVALDVPGQDPMPLVGKIDRIDENVNTGEWRVIDYKTGDTERSPCETHHGRKTLPDALDEATWEDLQLPLYHLLVTRGELRLPVERLQVGYVVLPRQSDGARWAPAEWKARHLEHAWDTAREVVRRIRARRFDVEAMSADVKPDWDDFARICQTRAFVREEINGDDTTDAGGDE